MWVGKVVQLVTMPKFTLQEERQELTRGLGEWSEALVGRWQEGGEEKEQVPLAAHHLPNWQEGLISDHAAYEVDKWLALCGDVESNPGPSAVQCPCCSQAPRPQVGPLANFPSNREVRQWFQNFRLLPGKSKTPLRDTMCSSWDPRIGGTRCREEGGCHSEATQCITYFITAPYYQACLQFIHSDKRITDSIKSLMKRENKIKKIASRTTPAAQHARAEHEQFLDETFTVVPSDIQDQIRACPNRWRDKVEMSYPK